MRNRSPAIREDDSFLHTSIPEMQASDKKLMMTGLQRSERHSEQLHGDEHARQRCLRVHQCCKEHDEDPSSCHLVSIPVPIMSCVSLSLSYRVNSCPCHVVLIPIIDMSCVSLSLSYQMNSYYCHLVTIPITVMSSE